MILSRCYYLVSAYGGAYHQLKSYYWVNNYFRNNTVQIGMLLSMLTRFSLDVPTLFWGTGEPRDWATNDVTARQTKIVNFWRKKTSKFLHKLCFYPLQRVCDSMHLIVLLPQIWHQVLFSNHFKLVPKD